ncbi:MAG: hypothetical protein GX984_06620 [Erysipelothrix sp.]|nr:hypothetical protein [Erysipelothrix sp.]
MAIKDLKVKGGSSTMKKMN